MKWQTGMLIKKKNSSVFSIKKKSLPTFCLKIIVISKTKRSSLKLGKTRTFWSTGRDAMTKPKKWDCPG